MSGLWPEELFEQLLVKERGRAERLNSPCALILADVRAVDEQRRLRHLETVSQIARDRVRLTDTVGFYHGRIGILLTDITPYVSKSICDYLQKEFKRRVLDNGRPQLPAPELVCEVYRHPF